MWVRNNFGRIDCSRTITKQKCVSKSSSLELHQYTPLSDTLIASAQSSLHWENSLAPPMIWVQVLKKWCWMRRRKGEGLSMGSRNVASLNKRIVVQDLFVGINSVCEGMSDNGIFYHRTYCCEHTRHSDKSSSICTCTEISVQGQPSGQAGNQAWPHIWQRSSGLMEGLGIEIRRGSKTRITKF